MCRTGAQLLPAYSCLHTAAAAAWLATCPLRLLQQISADLGVHEVHGHHIQHVCPSGHIVEDKAAIGLCKCAQLCASIQG